MNLLTAQEMADKLRIDYLTVLRMMRKGTIKATKVGGSWRVQEDELIRIITVK